MRMGKDTIANKRSEQYSGCQKWGSGGEVTKLTRPKKVKSKPERKKSSS